MNEFAIVWRVALYAILIAAAIGDMRRFEIPNYFPIAILVLLFAALVFSEPLTLPDFWSELPLRIAGGVLAFVIGLALFVLGVMGGGDAKLYAALGFWFGMGGLVSLTLFVAFAGLVVGIGAAIAFLFNPENVIPKRASAQNNAGFINNFELPLWRRALRARVPYGVAICLGAISASEIGVSVILL